MRIDFREIASGRNIADYTVEDKSNQSRPRKIYGAIEEACYALDLPRPIWLDQNIREFKRHAKTRFGQDSFLEELSFDFLEIQVLEEDLW